ncbi:hypothetical protein [Thermococcus sp. Bubb.Bath]|uniref:hypothetical protein n=1 Tax=Thermococcus sp. Bubb.Bath TaxID=1638242 RepID=UPI00143ADEB2|nr:hypothetical protein [Thermococcus sp. Bubb.Bath]NJF25986.1 hypothetical protein [Thermococcus sp. Bubb.Bath]
MVGSWILSILMVFWGVGDLAVGLFFGGALIPAAAISYQELEGADYIVTHYKGEGAIKQAMNMAKDTHNNSIVTWVIGGVAFFFAWIAGPIATILVGLGNLANVIMIFIAHGCYKELRKALLLLQITEKGNAEIAVKL